MKKNVLIVEDNKTALTRLEQIIGEIDKETEVYKAANSMQAYETAIKYTIDVFVIDIVLEARENQGDVSGIIFAQNIRKIQKYAFTPIIFTTSLIDPKFYAFTSIHSFAYLEKPYSSEEAKKILVQALEYTTQREQANNLFFRKDGLLFSIDTSDIVYIENSYHKLRIQTIQELLEMPYRSYKKLMQELDGNYFLQCNRNVIVNTRFVSAKDSMGQFLVLKNNFGRLEIGRGYKKIVKDKLQL